MAEDRKEFLRELNAISKRIEEIYTILGEERVIKPEEKTAHSQYAEPLEVKITKLLKELGAPTSNMGFGYIREAIILCMEDPTIFNGGITNILYPAIAEKFGTTTSRVERAIRHEKEIIFSRGNTEFVNELFPYYMGKATNSEFLATLVEYLRAN